MLKDFSTKALDSLILEHMGDCFEVISRVDGVLIYKREPFLWLFIRRVLMAKVCTDYVYVTRIVGNPEYERRVNHLKELLVDEFKTINRTTGVPGSIVVDFFRDSLR